MKNIKIIAHDSMHIEVVADSERFGQNTIMFQSGSFCECFDYIKRETGKDNLRLHGSCLASLLKDWTGKEYPSYMEVI